MFEQCSGVPLFQQAFFVVFKINIHIGIFEFDLYIADILFIL